MHWLLAFYFRHVQSIRGEWLPFCSIVLYRGNQTEDEGKVGTRIRARTKTKAKTNIGSIMKTQRPTHGPRRKGRGRGGAQSSCSSNRAISLPTPPALPASLAPPAHLALQVSPVLPYSPASAPLTNTPILSFFWARIPCPNKILYYFKVLLFLVLFLSIICRILLCYYF
uniref:Uncharacterized protein n=1 Tax=Cuerna arida TaxID=1464854 RepID=A0A1B6ETA2_9HEMI